MFWIFVFIEINKIIVVILGILVKVEVGIISPVDWRLASLILIVPKLAINHHYDFIE